MRVQKSLEVSRSRDEVVELVCCDESLLGLLPGKCEIIDSEGDQRTVRSHYRVLGGEGVATFDVTYLMDGNIRFQKVCDGRIWRELSGEVLIDEQGAGSRLRIELKGRTKGFVPEFTIKQPMEEQVEQMIDALRDLLSPS